MSDKAIDLVISPCPNDTFIFGAWIGGLISDVPAVSVRFHDVDETNSMAAHGDGEVIKVSAAALPNLLTRYRLLPLGGALGHGCGPLVLTRPGRDTIGSVAIPGEQTTAYLLFRLWAEQNLQATPSISVLPFHQIMPAVAAGEFDAGLVIHEARFTYPDHGLAKAVDLGQWWEDTRGLPIPLGAILARRDLDPAPIIDAISRSLAFAQRNPEALMPFVMDHAQEMDPNVAKSHIGLYVNHFSEHLGDDGYAAIDALLDTTIPRD